MIYLTGFHAIEEHIKAKRASHAALLVAKGGPRAKEIEALAVKTKIRIDRVGTVELDRIAPGHRGIVLEIDGAAGSPDISLEEFLEEISGEREGQKPDILVAILDEITDPHNYGAILRSCDQAGVDLVISRRRRTAKHADVIAKTSAGASAWVRQAETANLPRAASDLKEAGFWVYGADMAGEDVFRKNLRGRTAVVFGAEGAGISRLLRESCDALIAVPSLGRIDSLNVSVAAGVIFYEALRQRMTGDCKK